MKRWSQLALQLLSLVLFGLILWLGRANVWQQIVSGDLRNILIAFLLLGTAGMLSTTRLQLIAHSVAGQELAPWRRFYHLNMTARALGLIIPRGLSTFAGKPVALRSLGLSFKYSAWAVLLDNLFDLVLLSLTAAPGLLFLIGNISPTAFLALSLSLTLVLGAGLWWVTANGRLPLRVKVPTCISQLSSILQPDSENAGVPLLSRSTALQALALTTLINVVLASRFYFIARAVGVVHPWFIFFASFPLTQLSLILAVTPGGLGLFDAGWYGVLLLGGVSHQDALTFVIAQRAYIFVFVLIWAGVSALLSLTVKERGRE
jgi:uncharacterized membrane protein YbhN (UPF0104 family)